MKNQLNQQIEFAKGRMADAESKGLTRELDTWNGYIQGLRFCLGLDDKKSQFDQQIVEQWMGRPTCQCDANDLQPFGECVCGTKYEPIPPRTSHKTESI